MAERTSGLYRLITIPSFYDWLQNLLGGRKARQAFADAFFNDLEGLDVLEVGCGPATWYPHQQAAKSYTGVDWNPAHIATARENVTDKSASFICGDVSTAFASTERKFDRIFAFGLLHHLDDDQATALVANAKRLLAEGGRFITIDPVYHDNQNVLARLVKHFDSGQNIRTQSGYTSIVRQKFDSVDATIFKDKLRIPYSHCVMACQ